ncbi:acyl-ACP--UDP-N-acetylglucosamine O-acyltransferase [Candidatus Omnitrophota bacterium]
MKAHPTAIVSKKAKIAENVEIGPYSIIEDDVVVGSNSVVGPHVHICDGTTIGQECRIHIGAVLGDEPQDLGYKGEESYLKIGDRNRIREYATIHRGSREGSSTVIGDDNYIMGFAHIGHNCQIGNSAVICNNSLLGGYARIGDSAFLSAASLVHQFVRIGDLALLSAGARVGRDVPPYMLADKDNTIASYNIVGIKRAGLGSAVSKEIKEAFKVLYRSGLNLSSALSKLEQTTNKEVRLIVDFIKSSERGICFSHSNRNE